MKLATAKGKTRATEGPAAAVVRGTPRRIDIHHHLLPPSYIAEIISRRVTPTPAWTPAKSIEEMDKSGIATSVVSLIQPGIWLGDVAQGRRLAREVNEYAARMVADYPGRFGMFAVPPLPDTEGSLREIEYAMDLLKADGIGVMTSYGDKYLGDEAFAPVWEELNRRKAVVYTHPLVPACCKNLVPEVPPPTIEYATDTTRTIASLLVTGTAARFPDIRWIFSHAGGTTPFLISRFTHLETIMKNREQRLPKGIMYELKKFYYETAQANHPGALAALMQLVSASQVLFGTDFPLRPAAEAVDGLAAYRFKAKELRAIERDNALRLMPQLQPPTARSGRRKAV
jgi:predicted TIM-barrel fold metal-dependent hydrolase